MINISKTRISSQVINSLMDEENKLNKIHGEDGYISSCIYKDGWFQTWTDRRNRIEIIRWKHDLWLPERIT